MTDTETTRVAHLSELEGYSDEGRATWRPIRSSLGVQAFGINAWEATEAGQEVIGEHDELGEDSTGHEELYLVTSGRARFTVDDREIEAPAGTLVFVSDPATRRGAVADEPGTTILVVGAKRGEAFEVSAWERSAAALRFWKTGEWEQAIELLSGELAKEPERAPTLYNLACAESRAGRPDDALSHLQRAVELEERFRAAAQDDPDFEAIRADPRFPAAG
jgi:tetratricopeptide (TPR) repeat protein